MPILGINVRKVLEKEREFKNHIQQQANTIRALDEMVEQLYAENQLLKPIAISVLNLINEIDVSEGSGNYWHFNDEQKYKDLVDKVQDWQVKIHNRD